MRDSLRARLLLWYSAILALVIVSFAAAAGYLVWRARVATLDAELAARADALAAALEPATAGTFDFAPPPAPPGTPIDHVVWTADGTLIDQTDPSLAPPLPAAPGPRTRAGRREVAVRTTSGAWILTGRSLAPVRAELLSLAGTFALVGGAALALSLVGGWWWVGRALAPIDRISRTARSMRDGDFSARIPVEHVETELGQVASALNDAFDRLHETLERQRRFAADASHELRTPLTTLSTELQWARARDRSPDDYRRSLDTCARASARMEGVVLKLLALARAEAGADDDRRQPVRLDQIVRAAAGQVERLAAGQQVALDVQTEFVEVTGDPDRLLEAVGNVVLNAVQYTRSGGRVDVAVAREGPEAIVRVRDTGPGIAPADLPRVFDPFVRADPARSRAAGGSGLGLAVTRAILQRHGGRISGESALGRGTTMTMRIPATARTR
ncbi:MAG: HAMP domain-containing sensor histidine kinase [Vicinamibacterales bacterium]